MSEDSYHAQMYLAAHLKVDHGYSWARLKKIFTGRGEHFWDDVKHKVWRMHL